jgi:peptidoglycan/LPS O-acetylase OafA/YrhL
VLALFAHWHEVFGGHFYAYYLFLQIYAPHGFHGGLGVAWTLCIEVSFYILLPAYAWAMSRVTRRPRTEVWCLLALAALSIVFREVMGAKNYQIFPTASLLGTWVWFVPGMVLAIWSVSGDEAPRIARELLSGQRANWCWLGALGVFLLLAYQGSLGIPNLVAELFAPVVALLLLAPAIATREAGPSSRSSVPERILSHRVLLWLGLLSYPIYLYHATFMAWLQAHDVSRLFPFNHWVALALASSIAAVGAAAISWYCVERPVLRWGKRVGPPRTVRVVAPQPETGASEAPVLPTASTAG